MPDRNEEDETMDAEAVVAAEEKDLLEYEDYKEELE